MVEVEPLKPGVAGVEQTVAKVTRMIRAGASNPLIIEEARRAVRRARPGDTAAEWRELWGYVTGLMGFPYRFDPVDVEHTSAAHLGNMPGGDCDDFAVRCGAYLEALGYPVKVEVGGKLGTNGKPAFHHVYVVAMDPRTGKWSTFDPTLDKPGRFAANPGDRMQTEVQRRFTVTTNRPVFRQVEVLPPERSYARGPRPVRRRGVYGYSDLDTYGYTQLGGPLDFFKKVVSKVSSVTDVVYDKVLKHIDPTREDNAWAKSAVEAIPLFGKNISSALDTFAGVNEKFLKPGVALAKQLPASGGGSLTDAQVRAVYEQEFGHPPTAKRWNDWQNWIAQNKPTLAALQTQMRKPIYAQAEYDNKTTGLVFTQAPPQLQTLEVKALPTAVTDLSVAPLAPRQTTVWHPPAPGMSTGTKVAIGVGGAAVLGLGAFLVLRPKPKKARRRKPRR